MELKYKLEPREYYIEPINAQDNERIIELRLALRLCPDHPTIRALLAEKLFVKSPGSSEAQWFLNSAKQFFEAPVLELPEHVSEYQYRLGKEVIKRIDR